MTEKLHNKYNVDTDQQFVGAKKYSNAPAEGRKEDCLTMQTWMKTTRKLHNPPLPAGHAVFWKQRDLQDFRATHNLLLAGGGDRLPRHSVDLVEGMRAEVAVVRGADEQQQAERLLVGSDQLETQRYRCDEQLPNISTVTLTR